MHCRCEAQDFTQCKLDVESQDSLQVVLSLKKFCLGFAHADALAVVWQSN